MDVTPKFPKNIELKIKLRRRNENPILIIKKGTIG